jgi:DNA-binding MarR family transcriptional regulator
MVGRIAIKPNELKKLVSPKGTAAYYRAYNLCDGTRRLSEVADSVGLDYANLRKVVQRWIDAGAVFRVGNARDRLLHVYALSEQESGVPSILGDDAARAPDLETHE